MFELDLSSLSEKERDIYESFTDIDVNLRCLEESYLYPSRRKLPSFLMPYVKDIVQQASKIDLVDFSIVVNHDRLRGHRIETIDGPSIMLRRMPRKIFTLEECRVPGPIRAELLAPRLSRGGLVLVCGKPGNGKSTTCAAAVVERLRMHGGICLTVEDPVEMPLHGEHGDGYCKQTNLANKEAYAEAVRGAMRAYPTSVPQTMMLIGEVRDPDTAALMLRASVDGRLILTTTHAGSVVGGLQRVLSLAAEKMGMKEAKELLSSSIRLVIHQHLNTIESDSGVSRRLNLEFLMDTSSAAGKILSSEGTLELLGTDIQQQLNMVKSRTKIPVRELK